MAIEVKPLSDEERRTLDIPASPVDSGDWSVWSCATSEFDWEYTDTEEAYLYRGQVVVVTPQESVTIKAGDFVRFPKGLCCRWKVIEPVEKVYRFV